MGITVFMQQKEKWWGRLHLVTVSRKEAEEYEKPTLRKAIRKWQEREGGK